MVIPIGYKKTEVGLIPKEWQHMKLQDIIEILTDFTANGSFASLAENVKYLNAYDYARLIRLTDIRANFNNQGIYVSKESYEFLKKSKLFGGELLLANVGAYAGYSFSYPKNLKIKGTLGPNMFLIKVKKYIVSDEYAKYIFSHGLIFNQLLTKASSSAQPKLNKENVRECDCVIPKLEEQKLITCALSDIDDLISSLEKIIEKKKAIKIGTMQELLTGKRRLDGFTGAWTDTTVGAVCDVFDGTHQTPRYVEKGIPFYSVENVTNNEFKSIKYISPEEHEVLTKSRCIEKGDILMTRIGSIGVCKYIDWDVNASYYVSLALIKCKKVNAKFLTAYSYTKGFQNEIELNSLPSATPKKINLVPISDIKIRIPKTEEEQKILADIVFDLDTEILTLESKLSKYRQIKQGMMQELLTGRIRLT